MNEFTVNLFRKITLRIFQMLIKELKDDFYTDGDYQGVKLGYEDNIQDYIITMQVEIKEK